MAQILDDILKKTREDLEKRKVEYPLEWLGRSLAFNPFVPKDVKSALRSTKENPYRIIAEVKKASPSKGVYVKILILWKLHKRMKKAEQIHFLS